VRILLEILACLVAFGLAAIFGLLGYVLADLLQKRARWPNWAVRMAVAIPAAIAFVSTFMLTGTAAVLDASGEPPGWREAMATAVLVGVLFGGLWPLGKYARTWWHP
jgi:uncharacterized membrane protein